MMKMAMTWTTMYPISISKEMLKNKFDEKYSDSLHKMNLTPLYMQSPVLFTVVVAAGTMGLKQIWHNFWCYRSAQKTRNYVSFPMNGIIRNSQEVKSMCTEYQ